MIRAKKRKEKADLPRKMEPIRLLAQEHWEEVKRKKGLKRQKTDEEGEKAA